MINNYKYPLMTVRGFLCRIVGLFLLLTSPVMMPFFIIFDNRKEIKKYFEGCIDLMHGDVND